MDLIRFLIIILLLVTVHELGHYIVAKIFNVYVSEFALGFGPKIFQRQGKETLFTIRLLPLGGYAAMLGESSDENEEFAHIPFERTLKGVNRGKQFLIYFAGSFMNFVLAFILFIAIAMSQPTVNQDAIIGQITPNSPAYNAGLKENDLVKKITQDGKDYEIKTFSDISQFSQSNTEGKPYTMTLERANETLYIDLVPEFNEETKSYVVGISAQLLPAETSLAGGIQAGYMLSVEASQLIFGSVIDLFTGNVGVDELSGPVGIFEVTKDINEQIGIWGLVNFTALLSVNLAIFNLLPIPALDGGRLLIVTIESIIRKSLSEKVEAMLINISFILLMILIIFVTFKDVINLFN